jgi:hypothetical protein
MKKYIAFYKVWRFITVFTWVSHWTISWGICIQYTSSHFVSLRSILKSYSYLCPCLPSCLFHSGFAAKFFMRIYHLCHAYCVHHPSHPDLMILTVFSGVYKLWNSLLSSFLQPPVMSSLLGLNIVISTLFSNPVSQSSSLGVKCQVSYPHKTADKIKVSIFQFLCF